MNLYPELCNSTYLKPAERPLNSPFNLQNAPQVAPARLYVDKAHEVQVLFRGDGGENACYSLHYKP